jgi:5-methylcytosine-specific restriction endonuclease McrA
MVVRPCLVHRCVNYAVDGRSYCAQHRPYVGTTPRWRKARKEALRRARHRCQRCGATQRLEVHHQDGRGIYAAEHDQALLEVLCATCHRNVNRP